MGGQMSDAGRTARVAGLAASTGLVTVAWARVATAYGETPAGAAIMMLNAGPVVTGRLSQVVGKRGPGRRKIRV